MKIKDSSVDVKNLLSPIVDIIPALDALFEEYTGKEMVITSGAEDLPIHKPNSRHYEGLAIDARVTDIPLSKRKDFARDLRALLPRKLYDIVFEENPPHLHIEFDPEFEPELDIEIRVPESKPAVVGEYKVFALQSPEFGRPFILYVKVIDPAVEIVKTAVKVGEVFYGGLKVSTKTNVLCRLLMFILNLLRKKK